MACAACDPELAPTGPRRDAQHFAVRFDDWDKLVAKDGKRIWDCYEVDVVEGRAWRLVTPYGLCDCGKGAAAYIDTGNFSVWQSVGGQRVSPREGTLNPR